MCVCYYVLFFFFFGGGGFVFLFFFFLVCVCVCVCGVLGLGLCSWWRAREFRVEVFGGLRRVSGVGRASGFRVWGVLACLGLGVVGYRV